MIDNNAARSWHQNTASVSKKVKMMPGALHELTKEPNNHSVIEAILAFRNTASKVLGVLPPVKYASRRALWRKGKFWVYSMVLYLFVGLLVAVMRRKTNLFLSWPSLLVLLKRLR